MQCEQKLIRTESYQRLLKVAEAYSHSPIETDSYRVLSAALERYGIKNVIDTNQGIGWGKYGPAIIRIIPDKNQNTKHALSHNAFRFWMTGQTELAWAPGWKQGAEGCFFTDYVGSKRILLHTHAFLDALKSPYLITPVVSHEAVHLRTSVNREKKKPGIFYGKILHSEIPGYQEYMSIDEVPAWIVTLLELLERPKDPKDLRLFISSVMVLIRSSTVLETFYKREFESFKWVKSKEGFSVEQMSVGQKIKITELFGFTSVTAQDLEKRIVFYEKLRSFFKQFIKEDFIKKQFDLNPDQLGTVVPVVAPDFDILYPLLKNKKEELRQVLRSAF